MNMEPEEYATLQNLRATVAYVLGRQTSDDPVNDEPFALTGDGYLYWMLRHAYDATLASDTERRPGDGPNCFQRAKERARRTRSAGLIEGPGNCSFAGEPPLTPKEKLKDDVKQYTESPQHIDGR